MPPKARRYGEVTDDAPRELEHVKAQGSEPTDLSDALRHSGAFGVRSDSPGRRTPTAVEQVALIRKDPPHGEPEDKPVSLPTASQVLTPGHQLCKEGTSDSRSPMTTQVLEGRQLLQGTDQDTMEPLEVDLRELDNELKSRQNALDNVNSLYQHWMDKNEELSENEKNLSEISTYIEELEKRKSGFERENKKIGGILKKLRISTLHQQEESLASPFSKEVSSSTQEIVGELLQKIKTERKEIDDKKCSAIIALKEQYQLGLKRSHKEVEYVKGYISEMLIKSVIEIEIDIVDTYIHENDCHPLKSARECVTKLGTVYQQNSYIESGQARRRAEIKCSEKWEEMRSTRFFQQKVRPFLTRKFCAASVEALNAALKFLGDSETTGQKGQQENFSQKIKDVEGQQKTFHEKVQESYAELEVGLRDPGFREANSLYEASLDQHRQAQKALEKRKELRDQVKRKRKASDAEKEHWKKGIQYLETAIADLKNPEKDQKKHHEEFLQQEDIREYSEINNLYEAMLKKNTMFVEAKNRLIVLDEQLKDYDARIIPRAQNIDNQDDKSEFGSKLEAFIRERISVEKQYRMMLDDVKAICDYYDSIAIMPLQTIISQNQEAISGIENDMADHRRFYDDTKEENNTIKAAIEEMRRTPQTALIGGADSATSVSFDWLGTQREKLLKDIEDLTSRQERIRTRLMSSPQSQEALGAHDATMTSTSTLREIARQEGASDQSLKWLEVRAIAKYTERLRNVYLEKYGTKMDIDKIVASAKFLRDQRLVVKNTEKYIAIAADLVHEFDAGLNSFYFHRKTFQVIVKPSDRRDLVPLKLSPRGELFMGKQKLKGSVIASRKGDPDEWILSRRGSQEGLFAAGMVMQQSGSGKLEDLGKLKKDGSVNIFTVIAGREFAEEAPGFEIVSGTLKKDKDEIEREVYIRFFRAEAEKAKTTIDIKGNDETIGTWSLDIMKLIKENKLDTDYDFLHNRGKNRLKIKEMILRAALEKGAISRFPTKADPAWEEYFIESYDVNHMVNRIEERIGEIRTQARRQARKISWSLRGEDK